MQTLKRLFPRLRTDRSAQKAQVCIRTIRIAAALLRVGAPCLTQYNNIAQQLRRPFVDHSLLIFFVPLPVGLAYMNAGYESKDLADALAVFNAEVFCTADFAKICADLAEAGPGGPQTSVKPFPVRRQYHIAALTTS
jgi:hypothetical protein